MVKSFSLQFEELVWRVMPSLSADNNCWALELRDPERKSMSVAIVDIEKQNVIWQGIPAHADWWTFLTAFSGKQFFLHAYRYPEVPEPTDLFAYKAITGDFQWVMPGHVLKSLADDQIAEVITKSGDRLVTKYADAQTGAFRTEGETWPPAEEKVILAGPNRYKKRDQYFERLAEFIYWVTGGHRAEVIDYLEKRPFMIFSYYIYDQDKTVQYLLIVTDTREIILHERLSEEREGVGHSTILLKAWTLVYLKNRNEFSSLTLS